MSNRDYLLLIYTCMCIILFLMIKKVSKVTKSAYLVRVWEWHGIDTDCPGIRDPHTQSVFSQKKKIKIFFWGARMGDPGLTQNSAGKFGEVLDIGLGSDQRPSLICRRRMTIYTACYILFNVSYILCFSNYIQISSLISLCFTCTEESFKPKIYKKHCFKTNSSLKTK